MRVLRLITPLAVVLAASSAWAQVRMSTLFGSDMALQRGERVSVWGQASPGEAVSVTLKTPEPDPGAPASVIEAKTTAGEDGSWRVNLDTRRVPSAPSELTVKGTNELVFTNVAVGEVWVCGGQSNMGWQVQQSNNPAEEIAAARWPQIRLFSVKQRIARGPTDELEGKWVVCSPETVGTFSAVGYYFGRELHKARKVPVGLINSSWGGTPADAWTSDQTLRAGGEWFEAIVKRRESALATTPEKINAWADAYRAWEAKTLNVDAGNEGEKNGWHQPAAAAPGGWKAIEVPGSFQSRSGSRINGAIWFRRTFTATEAQAKAGQLRLGRIDAYDTAYINGTRVGGTSTADVARQVWTQGRFYNVPAGVVKAGENTVVVRVFNRAGDGGFTGRAGDLRWMPAEAEGMSLSGAWEYAVEKELPYIEASVMQSAPPRPPSFDQNSPASLYDGMIEPLFPFTVRGFTWYQGESNAGRAAQYVPLMTAMIDDWRRGFEAPDAPFLIVQLANYLKKDDAPREDPWPELREAQRIIASKVRNAGLALAIDIGEADDIHPRNKQDVGARLALQARKVAYGETALVASGPTFKSVEFAGNTATIRFNDIGGGLKVKGEKLTGFTACGDDRKWVWAEAKVVGDTVVVTAPGIEKLAAVRYAWANNPDAVLYNTEGLPAVPFKTDDFPWTTADKR